jgi:hypothetical protein
MALTIKEVAGNLHEATVTPPHAEIDWLTAALVCGRCLTNQLLSLGCQR